MFLKVETSTKWARLLRFIGGDDAYAMVGLPNPTYYIRQHVQTAVPIKSDDAIMISAS